MKVVPDRVEQQVLPVLRRHDVTHAAIFGSFARGEEEVDSDLDILVELPSTKSLLDLVALKLDLGEVLGRKVDVLTSRALHPRTRERVLQEGVEIL